MRTADFDYDLPRELVAQEPATPRDASRLMVLKREDQSLAHLAFRDLPGLLRRGDLLVVNDTRVMAARLFGRRTDTGGAVEILLIRPLSDLRWEAMMGPARQAQPGRAFDFDARDGPLRAVTVERTAGIVTLDFERPIDPGTVGSVPLPPYITGYRGDPERYQTIYAREPTSAAAPTAGLHFTNELLQRVRDGGVGVAPVRLDVGPGTFKPVSVEDPHDHNLHAEYVAVPPTTAAAIATTRASAGRVVAVGTTVVRTLEHVARTAGGDVVPYEGSTSLRILPGDRFLVVDALITNFHLPRSTLLMLVSAFAGSEWTLECYRLAVRERYRFYSFGDAMFIA
jgi:S-adenosylmethionine:tRNA ribosyltransferase-isomerase